MTHPLLEAFDDSGKKVTENYISKTISRPGTYGGVATIILSVDLEIRLYAGTAAHVAGVEAGVLGQSHKAVGDAHAIHEASPVAWRAFAQFVQVVDLCIGLRQQEGGVLGRTLL